MLGRDGIRLILVGKIGLTDHQFYSSNATETRTAAKGANRCPHKASAPTQGPAGLQQIGKGRTCNLCH